MFGPDHPWDPGTIRNLELVGSAGLEQYFDT